MTTADEAPANVSCRALQFFFEYLEDRHHSIDEFLADLPPYPGFYRSPFNWITYDQFEVLERR